MKWGTRAVNPSSRNALAMFSIFAPSVMMSVVKKTVDVARRPGDERYGVSPLATRRCKLARAQHQAVPSTDDQFDPIWLELFGQCAKRLA